MKRIEVRCPKCNEFLDERDVEFVNVEEGWMGEDILTFICPICKTEQQSKRFG